MVAYQGKAEREFRALYPHTNVRVGATHPFEVYAGDYVCAEGRSRAQAFQTALIHATAGLITPEPTEVQTEGFAETIQ